MRCGWWCVDTGGMGRYEALKYLLLTLKVRLSTWLEFHRHVHFSSRGKDIPDKEKSWCAAHDDSAFCSITVNYIWQRTYILYIYICFCMQWRCFLCFVVSFLESIYRSADISRSEIYRYLGICCPIYADIKTYFTPNNAEKVAQGNVIVKFSVKFTDKL